MAEMHKICDALISRGFAVWTDDTVEPGSPSWQREIERAIDNSRCLVVVLSREAKESEWVEKEITYAQIRGIPILPILLAGVAGQEHESVPIGLITHQWLDLRSQGLSAPAINQLLSTVCSIVNRARAPVSMRCDRQSDLRTDSITTRPAAGWRKNLPPRRYERLIGRDSEVRQVMKNLSDSAAGSMVLISGLGGTGKTALAFEVVQQCMMHGLFQSVLWETARLEEFVGIEIVARQEPIGNYNAFLTSIARQAGLQQTAEADHTSGHAAVRDLLRRVPYLIVLDNLEDVQQAEVWVHRLSELVDPSRVLLTSRTVAPSFGGAYQLQIKGLEVPHSLELLRTEAGRRGSLASRLAEAPDTVLLKVHSVTGGMPLALQLVVGQVALGYAVEEILESLSSAKVRQEAFYQFVFSALWSRLTENSQKLLITLATFEGSVARAMLQKVAGVADGEFGPAAAQLTQASLLETNDEVQTEKIRYNVHPLTRSFVRSDLREQWKQQKASFPKK